MLEDWSEVLVESFEELWLNVIQYVPSIVVAVLIFILGWMIASVLSRWVAQLLRSLKMDNILQSLGVQDVVNRAGYRLDSGAFMGALVKLFIVIAFLVAALEVLNLSQINDFLREVILSYIPNVIAAAIILLLAAVIADILQKIVTGSAQAAGVVYAELLGGITRWAIWIFALLAAMYQLDIGAQFAQILFTGLIAMLAIAGGLAFGLGGRDAASDFIEKLRKDISKK